MQQSFDTAFNLGVSCLRDGHLGDKHHVVAGNNIQQTQPDYLAYAPANPVANHGSAYSLADREPKATDRQSVWQHTDHQKAIRPTVAVSSDLLKLGAFGQSMVPLQRLVVALTVGQRRRKAFPSALAAALDHILAVRSAHAAAETMYTQASAYLWLKSSLWHF